jgi:multidrug efflux pump
MTSFAFIMGVLPLVTSTGAGAEMRRAMGVAVFSGMLGVTLFGLFLTPVFYVVLREMEKRITGRAKPVNHSHGQAVPQSEPVLAGQAWTPAEPWRGN